MAWHGVSSSVREAGQRFGKLRQRIGGVGLLLLLGASAPLFTSLSAMFAPLLTSIPAMCTPLVTSLSAMFAPLLTPLRAGLLYGDRGLISLCLSLRHR